MVDWKPRNKYDRCVRSYKLEPHEIIGVHRLMCVIRDDLEKQPHGVEIARRFLGKSRGMAGVFLELPFMTEIPESTANLFAGHLVADGVPGSEIADVFETALPLLVRDGDPLAPLEGDRLVVADRFSEQLRPLLWENQPGAPKRPKRRMVDSRVKAAAAKLELSDRQRDGLVAVCLCSNNTRKRRSALELIAVASGCGLEVVDRWVAAAPDGVAPEREAVSS